MQKTMSTIFEPIFRAAYEDGGMDAARKVVEKLGTDAPDEVAKAKKPASPPE